MERLGTFLILPLELGAFGAMLLEARQAVAFVFLGLYALLVALRHMRQHAHLVIVAPKPHYRIAMGKNFLRGLLSFTRICSRRRCGIPATPG